MTSPRINPVSFCDVTTSMTSFCVIPTDMTSLVGTRLRVTSPSFGLFRDVTTSMTSTAPSVARSPSFGDTVTSSMTSFRNARTAEYVLAAGALPRRRGGLRRAALQIGSRSPALPTTLVGAGSGTRFSALRRMAPAVHIGVVGRVDARSFPVPLDLLHGEVGAVVLRFETRAQ